jgi:hypothetical protein
MNTTNTNTNKDLNVESTTNRYAQSYKKLLGEIEQAKNKIAAEFREVVALNQKSFQRALNEAEALARQTDYPHLLFPSLAMEKIQTVAAWQTRQQSQRHSVFAEAA